MENRQIDPKSVQMMKTKLSNSVNASATHDQYGQSILELTFCLPLILILVSGLANIGSMLKSAELIQDAVKSAGDYASGLFTPGSICSNIEANAKNRLTDYVKLLIPDEQENFWAPPSVTISTGAWRGVSYQYIRLEVRTNATPNCIFCYQNILSNFNYSVSLTYTPPIHCS